MALNELYQEVIIDHSRKPRNFYACSKATHSKQGYNPLCGDQITLYMKIVDDKIQKISFQGNGCAISTASASLMTEALTGKTLEEAKVIFAGFHDLVTKGNDEKALGKLTALAGVIEYPMRVKCATLAWHTMMAALKNDQELVCTE